MKIEMATKNSKQMKWEAGPFTKEERSRCMSHYPLESDINGFSNEHAITMIIKDVLLNSKELLRDTQTRGGMAANRKPAHHTTVYDIVAAYDSVCCKLEDSIRDALVLT
jgi:hypothetical protein